MRQMRQRRHPSKYLSDISVQVKRKKMAANAKTVHSELWKQFAASSSKHMVISRSGLPPANNMPILFEF